MHMIYEQIHICWKHVLRKCVLLPGILAPEGLAIRSCSKDEDRQLHPWSLLLSPLKRFRQACAECYQTNRTQGYVCPGFGLLGIFFFFLKVFHFCSKTPDFN